MLHPDLIIAAVPAFGAGVQAAHKLNTSIQCDCNWKSIFDFLGANALLASTLPTAAYAYIEGKLSLYALFGIVGGTFLGALIGLGVSCLLKTLDNL